MSLKLLKKFVKNNALAVICLTILMKCIPFQLQKNMKLKIIDDMSLNQTRCYQPVNQMFYLNCWIFCC